MASTTWPATIPMTPATTAPPRVFVLARPIELAIPAAIIFPIKDLATGSSSPQTEHRDAFNIPGRYQNQIFLYIEKL